MGDTLKCVSGGSHPGLLHIRQTEKGFEVTAFDQVEDGSRYLPTAKKNDLAVTMYQDYGWPAKKLKE